MAKFSNIEDAVLRFEDSAKKHANAMELGKSRIANRQFDVGTSCIKYLYEERALMRLSRFLNHEVAGVRLNTAFALLPFATEECERVLKAVADIGKGVTSFSAMMTLDLWNKGELYFPYDNYAKPLKKGEHRFLEQLK